MLRATISRPEHFGSPMNMHGQIARSKYDRFETACGWTPNRGGGFSSNRKLAPVWTRRSVEWASVLALRSKTQADLETVSRPTAAQIACHRSGKATDRSSS